MNLESLKEESKEQCLESPGVTHYHHVQLRKELNYDIVHRVVRANWSWKVHGRNAGR